MKSISLTKRTRELTRNRAVTGLQKVRKGRGRSRSYLCRQKPFGITHIAQSENKPYGAVAIIWESDSPLAISTQIDPLHAWSKSCITFCCPSLSCSYDFSGNLTREKPQEVPKLHLRPNLSTSLTRIALFTNANYVTEPLEANQWSALLRYHSFLFFFLT